MLTPMQIPEFLSIPALAFGLGCDAFAVGLSIGMRWAGRRRVFRLAFHFGRFQFLMPLLGWALGRGVVWRLFGSTRWLGAAILALVGLKMLWDAARGGPAAPDEGQARGRSFDPTRGWSLVGLSVATSLDALAVGIGMGVAGAHLLGPAAVIGVTAALMTIAAMRLGRTLSLAAGRRAELLGALMILAAAALLRQA
jgi:putative Mn2+ efflux pump MntP